MKNNRFDCYVAILWSSIVVLLFGCANVSGEFIMYNTRSKVVDGKLNVHLVPHSHDDVGWLKTVDQYYVGSNNSIQGAYVEYVLDSVVSSLLHVRNKKFIFAVMVILHEGLI